MQASGGSSLVCANSVASGRGRLNGGSTREALEEHTAKRVHVRPSVGRLVGDLLRRRVVDRPGKMRRSARIDIGIARQPEVRQIAVLAPALRRHEDVRGLDVPMHETPLVRGVERLADLRAQLERPNRLQRPLTPEQRREILTLDEAHRDPQLTVRLPRRVHRHDVGVVERRRQPSLTQEPLPETPISRQLRRDQLQRHPPVEPQVVRQIHDAHPATAHHRLQPVTGQLRADPRVEADRQASSLVRALRNDRAKCPL